MVVRGAARGSTACLAGLLILASVLVAVPVDASAEPAGRTGLAARQAQLAEDVAGEAVICTVRSDVGQCWEVDSRTGTHYGGYAAWGYCPAGYVEVGRDFHSNGFWLCGHSELVAAGARFVVGNVVSDVGYLYLVFDGHAMFWRYASWNECLPGSWLIGQDFHSNGWWLCLGLPPQAGVSRWGGGRE